MARCPQCQAPLETPLGCGACGRLLELDRDPTPFETLGLPVSYAIDGAELRRRLLRFSRLTHPDYFATAAADEKERAERATALVNKAYETLSDDPRRADWIVRSLGGPDENEERAMPQEFLAEVLEWNEILDEARQASRGPDHARLPALGDARLPALKEELVAKRREAIDSAARLLVPLLERGSPRLRDVRRELNAVRYVDRALAEIESLRLSQAETRR